jgi:hypothetical protein
VAGFDSALAEMNRVLNNAQAAPRMADAKDRARLIIEVRGQVIKQVAELYSCLSSDPRIAGNPEQAAEFRKRLSEVRQMLATLQAKWRASEMVADFEGYAHDSTPVAQACKSFVAWAQKARVAA